MSKSYDLVMNTADGLLALIPWAVLNGQFPASEKSRFLAGGEKFIRAQKFLKLYDGRGAVYVARDKHGKLFGISLILLAQQVLPTTLGAPASEFLAQIRVDEFYERLWNRSSVGGLYRRAKTQVRVRKARTQAEVTGPRAKAPRLDSDTGMPLNPDYRPDDEDSGAVLGHINF